MLSNIAEAPEFDHILYGDTVTDPGFGQMGSHLWSSLKNV